MITQAINFTEQMPSDSYQFIKDEHLHMVIISAQVLSSSRILLSTYDQVVFSDCTFYACDFDGITLENCIFENCIFEFSHFRNCLFKNCSFNNCTWKGASSVNSTYDCCDLGEELGHLCKNGKNTVTSPDRDHTTDIYINFSIAC